MRTSARSSAAAPTGSRTASCRSTELCTNSPATSATTICTAASRASTRRCGAQPRIGEHEIAIVLSHTSEDGDEGYPGRVDIEAVYSLTLDDVVRIEFRAVTTQPTVVNLTSHPMVNLAGEGLGTILEHELRLDADRYTPVDAELIPTGELAPVAGTPLDFRGAAEIGSRLGGDYDHNFVLNERSAAAAARLVDPGSGRALEIRTTEPGLQVYTGGNLDAASGGAYERFAGVALEPQRFPDSPHHPHFPSAVLRPSERYESTTELRFSTATSDQ